MEVTLAFELRFSSFDLAPLSCGLRQAGIASVAIGIKTRA